MLEKSTSCIFFISCYISHGIRHPISQPFSGQRSRRQACAHSSDPKVSLATLSGAQGPLSANAVGVRQTRMEFWIMLFAMTMA